MLFLYWFILNKLITHRVLIVIQTLTPKYIVLGEINVQMYTATEEIFQKYGEKSFLKLTLNGCINNNVDESVYKFQCLYLIF